MAVVYQHIRLDTNEVFYVGIGKTEKRAYSIHFRNNHWNNIVKKYGYYVEIIYDNLTWLLACQMEQCLIKEYGRVDLGTGNLVNMTDGGEGTFGVIRSEETRKKMSEAKKGKPLTEETRKNMSNACKGRKHSEETKLKFSILRKGENHPMYGKTGKNNPNFGLKRNEETKNKMSTIAKNRPNLTCPFCGKTGRGTIMKKWHFNKCKNK